jgi:hypothetical protein
MPCSDRSLKTANLQTQLEIFNARINAHFFGQALRRHCLLELLFGSNNSKSRCQHNATAPQLSRKALNQN